MTSHSDYAKTRHPKPMQVWEGRGVGLDGIMLILSVNPFAEHNQVRYRKLSGNHKGEVFELDILDIHRFYQFSH